MLNNLLVRALLEQPDAYEIVTFDKVESAPKDYVRQADLEWVLS